MTADTLQTLKPPTRSAADRALDLLVWGGIAVLLILSFGPVDMGKIGFLFTKSANLNEFSKDLLRPDFARWPLYVAQMWLTVQMALWGAFLAVLLAIPLGLLCAGNITPIWIQQPVRRINDLLRSIPDLVLGILFITAVGLGPLPGVLALAVNTGSVLAKLFSEAVESIDPRPVEGVRATGAHRLQEIAWGVIPQVGPLWTSYALYRFESNARSATVLGLIGAGGIGQTLYDSLNGFNFRETSAIVIVIVVAVTLIDLLSQAMRTRLL
ncbi:MAG: phosphonate ABC transporter, permease protein PhnE [Alphaproteobacteria bacterium]|nr:phosphonate ABC transporter, permease protein PhnE [Alphaproteobacteria bacterium]